MNKYPCNYTIQFSELDGGFVARCDDKPYQLLTGWHPNTPLAALAELLFVIEDVQREEVANEIAVATKTLKGVVKKS